MTRRQIELDCEAIAGPVSTDSDVGGTPPPDGLDDEDWARWWNPQEPPARPHDLDWITGRGLDVLVFFALWIVLGTTCAALGVFAAHGIGWLAGAGIGTLAAIGGTYVFHHAKANPGRYHDRR